MAEMIEGEPWFKKRNNQTNSLKGYSYNVNGAGVGINKQGLFVAKLLVKELHNTHTTSGGATFKTITTGNYSTSACPYQDYFNGSYLICCILREEFNHISIRVKNVNFYSYRMGYSHNKLIGEMTLTSERPLINALGEMTNHTLSKTQLKNLEANGHTSCYSDDHFWWREAANGSWRLVIGNEVSHHVNREEFTTCLDEKFGGNLVMVGDVPLEQAFFYLAAGTGKNVEQEIHVRDTKIEETMYEIGNMFYHRSTFVDQVDKHLKWFVNNTPSDIEHMHRSHRFIEYFYGIIDVNKTEPLNRPPHESSLMLLDGGLRDVGLDDAAVYIANFYKILKNLEKLKANGTYKLYWQNMFPWPGNVELDNGMHANTFVISAVNAWVALQMKILNIPVIDAWKLAYPFEDDWNPCGYSYLCKQENSWVGHAGIEVVHQFLREACDFL